MKSAMELESFLSGIPLDIRKGLLYCFNNTQFRKYSLLNLYIFYHSCAYGQF